MLSEVSALPVPHKCVRIAVDPLQERGTPNAETPSLRTPRSFRRARPGPLTQSTASPCALSANCPRGAPIQPDPLRTSSLPVTAPTQPSAACPPVPAPDRGRTIPSFQSTYRSRRGTDLTLASQPEHLVARFLCTAFSLCRLCR